MAQDRRHNVVQSALRLIEIIATWIVFVLSLVFLVPIIIVLYIIDQLAALFTHRPRFPPHPLSQLGHNLKVLMISDDPHISRLMELNLLREGCQFSAASFDTDILHVVADEVPDMILVNWPEGQETYPDIVGQLLEAEATQDIPMIQLVPTGTGSANPFYGTKITKPFNPMELLNILHRIYLVRESEEHDS